MDTQRLIKGSLAGVLVGASVAVAAYAAAPQGGTSATATDRGDASSAVVARAASGPNEGIKVHGRWVIEVTNPDGSVAERREFNNALVGGARLANVLARSKSVGYWLVALHAVDPLGTSTATGPCNSATAGFSGMCLIAETGSLTTSTQIFDNLTASASAATLRLSGSAIAATDSAVGYVATSMSDCAPTTAPSTPCVFTTASAFNPITAKTITPISVTTGQQIQVTVDISFQ